MNDEEVTTLANAYSERVSYGDAGDGAAQEDKSAETQSVKGPEKVSAAEATAVRSSMLKKFLALVEKKLNP